MSKPDLTTTRLDDAARAGWLYYVAGNTQDEIAAKLGISRQSAQRMVSLAVSEGLVKVRLDHPIARCLDLAEQLKQRFGLKMAEVVPTDPGSTSTTLGVADAAAAEMTRWLKSETPIVLGIGTGRTLKAAIELLSPIECPQHKVVSLTGNIAPDGSAAFYNVIFNIADKIKARSFPMPLPVIASSPEERELLHSQAMIRPVLELSAQATVAFVGIGDLSEDAPLFIDGFISREELLALRQAGGVCEIVGRAFDRNGVPLKGLTNDRVASAQIPSRDTAMVIAIAKGPKKLPGIEAALKGSLINGLITDEATAETLLDMASTDAAPSRSVLDNISFLPNVMSNCLWYGQILTDDFAKKNPDIKLEWVTLEENVLRQRVTTDIATKGGQYDVLTIGTYEVPIWAKQGWLLPLDGLGADYDKADLLPAIDAAVSVDGKLYASPFYGESAMVMYRKDLAEKAGVKISEKPTWDEIADAAKKMTDKSTETYGICLRGKAGWGENMALLTAMSNSFGGRWFDEKWQPQFDQPEWKKALTFYVDLMKEAGPPGASSNGFNENLALFQTGKCGIWIDATVAASFVTNPKDSKVADKVGYALFPTGGVENHGNWLWAWNLGIPASTKKAEAAQKFVSWATDKAYTELVASKEGWANVPPGTRKSLYANPEYEKAAPFAKITLDAMNAANTTKPTIKPVPYTGGQFVAIPEFQGIGTAVGQQFSAALAGSMKVDQALQSAQALTTREMTKGGYIK